MKPDPNEAIGSSYRNLSGTSGPAGTRLENEIVLAEQLGLSRPTMRRAIEYLVDRGLLVRRRGVGTQVVQPKVRGPVELSSLYDDLRAAWREPRDGRHQRADTGADGVHFYTRGKVVTSRWLDPSHGGINLGFPTQT
jgi:DNA-binding transcriptional MocR family regulator